MRIVGGRLRGRKLEVPEGLSVRPTGERARAAIFNILLHRFPDDLREAVVLDAFAGTGALGIEALSRGAARAFFMETAPAAEAALRINARGLEGQARVMRADATRPPAAADACGLAFLDPPYEAGIAGKALRALARTGWLAEGALCVVETAASQDFDLPEGFSLEDERRYGKAAILFVRHAPPNEEEPVDGPGPEPEHD